jgi:hypothetical protein
VKVLNCQTLGQMCEAALDGEPVFIIRAQDKAAVDAVKAYVRISHEGGGRNIIRSSEMVDRIHQWQLDNPNKVKVAD